VVRWRPSAVADFPPAEFAFLFSVLRFPLSGSLWRPRSWAMGSVGPRSGPRLWRIRGKRQAGRCRWTLRHCCGPLRGPLAAFRSRELPIRRIRLSVLRSPFSVLCPSFSVLRASLSGSLWRPRSWATGSVGPRSGPRLWRIRGEPVDVDGRCGIVADHSVVRWPRSAVANCPPAESASLFFFSELRPPFFVERFPMAAAFLGCG
jgi:hypothetical protein